MRLSGPVPRWSLEDEMSRFRSRDEEAGSIIAESGHVEIAARGEEFGVIRAIGGSGE